MGFSKGNSSTTLEDILNVVSEFQILAYYLEINTIPCLINSPLRKDVKPSFGIYSNNGIKLHYRDFRTRESGGTMDLLSALWGIPFTSVVERLTADLLKIANSTGAETTFTKKPQYRQNKKVYSSQVDLQVKVRPWRAHDLAYWEEYGISIPWLKFGNVHAISHVIVKKRGREFIIPADRHAYVYVEHKDDNTTLKIYQPFNTTFKWSNKHDSSVWDLWEQLPKSGENLVIASSRKDALCVWENTGIPSCSLQAESYLPKQHVVQELKDRFKNVFVLYDNDFNSDINYGRLLAEGMAIEFGLIQIEIPEEYQSKDPSDLCKNFNREKVKKVISHLIKEKQINNSF
jgi:hypothetical protein